MKYDSLAVATAYLNIIYIKFVFQRINKHNDRPKNNFLTQFAAFSYQFYPHEQENTFKFAIHQFPLKALLILFHCSNH